MAKKESDSPSKAQSYLQASSKIIWRMGDQVYLPSKSPALIRSRNIVKANDGCGCTIIGNEAPPS